MATVIAGVVRDSEGKPVADARIAFASAPVAVPDVALLTDRAGSFALAAPAPGRYVIGCYADGYAPATVSVDVASAEPVSVAIRLEPEH